MQPKNLKELQSNSRKLYARKVDKHTYAIESHSDPFVNHRVTVTFDSEGNVYSQCTCTWAVKNGTACSHVFAALEHMAAEKGRKLSFWLTAEDARRQKHRTFYVTSPKNRRQGVWITTRTA